MEMLDWSLIRSVLAVAEAGSLSGAARATGISQPTLGRHVQALFGRTAREAGVAAKGKGRAGGGNGTSGDTLVGAAFRRRPFGFH